MLKTLNKKTKIWIGIFIAIVVVAFILYVLQNKGFLLKGNLPQTNRACGNQAELLNTSTLTQPTNLCKNTSGILCTSTLRYPDPYDSTRYVTEEEYGCECLSGKTWIDAKGCQTQSGTQGSGQQTLAQFDVRADFQKDSNVKLALDHFKKIGTLFITPNQQADLKAIKFFIYNNQDLNWLDGIIAIEFLNNALGLEQEAEFSANQSSVKIETTRNQITLAANTTYEFDINMSATNLPSTEKTITLDEIIDIDMLPTGTTNEVHFTQKQISSSPISITVAAQQQSTQQQQPAQNINLKIEQINLQNNNIQPGADNIELVKFSVENANSTPINIKKIIFSRANADSELDFNKIDFSLIKNDNEINTEVSMNGSDKTVSFFYNAGSPIITINSNEKSTIILKGKISSRALASKTLQFKLQTSTGLILDPQNARVEGPQVIDGAKYTIVVPTVETPATPENSQPDNISIQLSAPTQPAASTDLQPGQTAEIFKFILDPIGENASISQIKVSLLGTLPREKIQKIQLFESTNMKSEATFDSQNIATFNVSRVIDTTINYSVKIILKDDAPNSNFKIGLSAGDITSNAYVTGEIPTSNLFTVKKTTTQTTSQTQTTQPNPQELQQLNDRIAQLQRDVANARQGSGQADPAVQQQLTSLTQSLLARQNAQQTNQAQTQTTTKTNNKISIEEIKQAAAERNKERAKALTLAQQQAALASQNTNQTQRVVTSSNNAQAETAMHGSATTVERGTATLAGASRLRQAPDSSQSGPGILLYPLVIALGNAVFYLKKKRKK